jgi:MoaE-MoaD fusion protein
MPDDSSMITVLLFAQFKDQAGTSKVNIELSEGTSISELKSELATRYPGLRLSLETALFAINQQFALEGDFIPANAEVAVFPPVSGGQPSPVLVKVSPLPIDGEEVAALVVTPTTGAVCTFTGVVRAVTQRGEVHETTRLEYDAYIPMAEVKINQIVEEIRELWPAIEGIAILQRIGPIEPGGVAALVSCSAAHRDTGVFEGARYGIDRLKEIVPIWKKEIGPDGTAWVEGDYWPGSGD